MRANEASVKELKASRGLLKGKELIDKQLTFWTITIWENEESMKGFRGSSSHRIAMQQLPKWCNEASYHHWVQEDDEGIGDGSGREPVDQSDRLHHASVDRRKFP
jgi:hypothetical protein